MLQTQGTHVLLYSKSYLLQGGTVILSNSNLNDDKYKVPGNYYCNNTEVAASLQNAPFSVAFTLKVEQATGSSEIPCQTARNYQTGAKAWREYNPYSKAWTKWVYFSDDATVSLYQTVTSTNDVLQSAESQQSNQAKFYYLGGSNYTGDIPSGGSYGYGTAIALKRGSSSIFVVIFSIGKPIYNAYNNSRWEGWKYFDGTSAQ